MKTRLSPKKDGLENFKSILSPRFPRIVGFPINKYSTSLASQVFTLCPSIDNNTSNLLIFPHLSAGPSDKFETLIELFFRERVIPRSGEFNSNASKTTETSVRCGSQQFNHIYFFKPGRRGSAGPNTARSLSRNPRPEPGRLDRPGQPECYVLPESKSASACRTRTSQ